MRATRLILLGLGVIVAACESTSAPRAPGDIDINEVLADLADGPAPCVSNRDCRGGQVCRDSRCRELCTDGGCPAGFRCLDGTACYPEDTAVDREEPIVPEDDREAPADGPGDLDPPADTDADIDGNPDAPGDEAPDPTDDTPGDTIDTPPARCTNTADCDLGNLCVGGNCEPGCLTNRDCPAGASRCDTSVPPRGRCVQCRLDTDCPAGGRCRDGACTAVCRSNADCPDPARSQCDTQAGECRECVTSDACGTGRICKSNRCVEGCTSARDCPQGRTCAVDAAPDGRCVACTVDAQCAANQRCADYACVAACSLNPCAGNTAAPFCDAADGRCYACLIDNHCPQGTVCRDRACAAGCRADGDCRDPLKPRCRIGAGATSGVCTECLSTNDCRRNEVCRGGDCVLGCTRDEDCGAGAYCQPLSGECRALPPGGCTPGLLDILGCGGDLTLKCDPLSRTCRPRCDILGICLLASLEGVCIDSVCYDCERDDQCSTRCNEFRTCATCRGDGDCRTAGYHCDAAQGVCFECASDSHCPAAAPRCRPGDNRACVECLVDGDCRQPGKPHCGRSGTCLPPCSNDCTTSGDVLGCVDATNESVCGQFDDDRCLDAGSRSCGSRRSCTGSAGCTCNHACSSDGARRCTSNTSYTVCNTDGDGCRYLTSYTCSSGYYCSGGQCYQ